MTVDEAFTLKYGDYVIANNTSSNCNIYGEQPSYTKGSVYQFKKLNLNIINFYTLITIEDNNGISNGWNIKFFDTITNQNFSLENWE